MNWKYHAACKGMDTELFFGEKGANIDRTVCEECPVQQECLEFGLDEKFGVWGGKSVRERRKLRKERAKEALGKAS